MDIVVFPPPELPAALAVLRSLDVRPSPRAAQFIDMLARLHGSDPASLSASQTNGPVAAIIRDPQRRKRLVQLAAIRVMVDGKVSHEHASAVAALARALQVKDRAVPTLHKLAERRRLATRFAVMGRIMAKFVPEAWRDQGFAGVKQVLSIFTGRRLDELTAARYRALGTLPPGSLGRSLYEHCRSRNFALPGEPDGLPERMLFHDVGHVLSGYDTDPAGEIQQAAFQAGFMRNDGFAFLFFGIVQFHFGMKMTPVAAAEVGYFDITKVLTALARGAACNVDLSDNWDFWAVANEPLEHVRQALGVPPLDPVRPLAA